MNLLTPSSIFQDSLRDISGLDESHNNYGKLGICNCQNCGPERRKVKEYTAEACTPQMEACSSVPMEKWNSSMTKMCKDVPCFECRDVRILSAD